MIIVQPTANGDIESSEGDDDSDDDEEEEGDDESDEETAKKVRRDYKVFHFCGWI